jgi:beta-lactamase class A
MRLLPVIFAFSLLAPVAAAERAPDLSPRAQQIVERVGGSVGFAVLHIESGRLTAVNGRAPMALFSVFKLPVAIVVLEEVEAGRLRLDEKVHVDPSEAAGGAPANAARWTKPVDTTIRELIRLSIIHSDNTSVDKLLQIVGGPEKVTHAMEKAGFPGIKVRSSVRNTGRLQGPYPNVASAEDLVRLLAALHRGDLLKPAGRDLVLAFMRDAVTGLSRIRGDLPEGVPVGDKTGTGPATTNDVGIVTLPGDGGHIAIAALISDSKLSQTAQEKAIAELARAAYDASLTGRR